MGEEGDNGGINNANGIPPHKRFYKVAFSFTSGVNDVNRDFVRSVAEILRDTYKIPQDLIFFDEWVGMYGITDADKQFSEIYRKRSEFIVPFFCINYKKNNWTRIEGRQIRKVREENNQRVIPARFDGIKEIEGFEHNTDLFIDCDTAKENSEIKVAEIIHERIININVPTKLVHLNKIVKELNSQKINFGLKYIELRDVFIALDYENNRKHINTLTEKKEYWKSTQNSFNTIQLEKNLAEVFDYIYKYSKANQDYNILLKFLCILLECSILNTYDAEQVIKAIKFACHSLDVEYSALCNSDNSGNSDSFPFTNRNKELEITLNSEFTSQLVSAPVGYGKTTFLKRLKIKFEKKGFITFYSTIKTSKDIKDKDQICKTLGFKDKQDFLHFMLKGKDSDVVKKTGLVFLFVTQNLLAQDIKNLKNTIESLRLDIKNGLEQQDENYAHRDSKTRLIVSSLQLFGNPRNEIQWPYGFEEVRLSEFNYKVILKSVTDNNYLGYLDSNQYKSIVAKLTLMTAGHPAVVAEIATDYIEDGYLNVQRTKSLIALKSMHIASSIQSAEISGLFTKKTIPIYRYINDRLLSNITKKSRVKRSTILNSLLAHGLYQRKKVINGSTSQLIKDSLLRRTCAIDYCYKSPDNFAISCKNAKEYYGYLLEDQESRIEYHVLWLIEYWFSQLQLKLLSFVYPQVKYNELNNNIEIERSTNFLIHQCIDSKQLKQCQEVLLSKLKKDWEFRLLLNFKPYQDDKNCLDESKYQDLIKTINKQFKLPQGESHE